MPPRALRVGHAWLASKFCSACPIFRERVSELGQHPKLVARRHDDTVDHALRKGAWRMSADRFDCGGAEEFCGGEFEKPNPDFRPATLGHDMASKTVRQQSR